MNLDWHVFCNSPITSAAVPGCFAGAGDFSYLQWMLSAWGWTAVVAFGGLLVALALGLVVGALRTLPLRAARAFGATWTEVFRNIPLLVQIFLWYHVVPAFFPALRAMPAWLLALLALGLYTSARIAEQVRAGIQSLPAGQMQAALALGLSTAGAYRNVILPQALRIVLPALGSEAMGIVKNSSVAFAVSVAELTLFAMQAQEETARGIEIYAGVTLLYAVTALAVNRVFALLEARLRLPGQHLAKVDHARARA